MRVSIKFPRHDTPTLMTLMYFQAMNILTHRNNKLLELAIQFMLVFRAANCGKRNRTATLPTNCSLSFTVMCSRVITKVVYKPHHGLYVLQFYILPFTYSSLWTNNLYSLASYCVLTLNVFHKIGIASFKLYLST